MPRRYYSSTAQRTTLASGISASATTLTVTSAVGFPASYPWTAILSQDTASEEVINVTGASGTTLTVQRGQDGTAATSHVAGASFNHGVSARDFNEPNQFLNEGGTVTGPTVIEVNSSSDALRITQTGSGNALEVEDSANPDASPFVIDADGRVILGDTTARTVAVNSKLQISGTGGDSFAQLVRFNSVAPTNDTGVILGRSRGSSFSARSAVQADDVIGGLVFVGDDSANWVVAARVQAAVDGTPGTNDMPGRLTFATTADGSATPTERMRIDSAGNVGIGTSSPATKLHVDNGSSAATARITGQSSTAQISAYTGVVEMMTTTSDVLYGTTAANKYASLWAGGTERMRITSAGNVGIGTSSPGEKLTVQDDSVAIVSARGNGYVASQLFRFSTDAQGPYALFVKARGTRTSPTVVADADTIGALQFLAYDGGANREVATIMASVDGGAGASDVPSRLQFYTTPDGGISNTERMRINNAGLITGTGTSLGAWTAYTPTLGGTGWAIGNGTATGAYCQIGKIVVFRVKVAFGTTSTFGTAQPTISLPVNLSAGHQGQNAQFHVSYLDLSAGVFYSGVTRTQSGATVNLNSLGTNSAHNALSSTVPFTWASTDEITINGTYEAV